MMCLMFALYHPEYKAKLLQVSKIKYSDIKEDLNL